jgi:ethanolamine utilization protein EutQ (cupin superfamily)
MDNAAFSAALMQDGYNEISTKSQPALMENGAHSHPFDVRALMLEGELTLGFDGKTEVYRAGDVFTMQAGCQHTEKFGPQGATYLVGRRQPA